MLATALHAAPEGGWDSGTAGSMHGAGQAGTGRDRPGQASGTAGTGQAGTGRDRPGQAAASN